jgi:hypothetical protein
MNTTATVKVNPKVGDILVGTYGYEARIATFVEVVSVSGSRIKVRELKQNRNYTGCGGMDWTATPVKNSGAGIVTKVFTSHEDCYRIKWTSYQSLYGPWDGQPVSCYNYH